ncbi:uncharacterized protein DNG_09217 [Cephalotrichum gorgonifer]|uniref:Uncharacterized protein n=1 Tax=Cephalotrichum gorgonifer TaxID=2041049 RepID=A0AAE8SZY0_9PEZI|nr:uncharacterized protein DNG_09217 [Cephalotrichum gorgonifer]
MTDGRILNPSVWGFMSWVFEAEDATTENPVRNLWLTALRLLFPGTLTAARPRAAYRVSFHPATLATNPKAGAILKEIRLTENATEIRVSADYRTRDIFFAECKKAGEDTAEGWERAETELAQYLEENLDGCDWFYCAVGIGTKASFYKWDRNRGDNHRDQLAPMHTRALDFANPADRPVIERYFEQIKNDGWDRTDPWLSSSL